RWILDQMEPFREHLAVAPQFWGEPFMSPYLKDMIRYARQKEIRLGFTTNGTLWDDDMIDFMIHENVQSLCVSMDGATKETYEKLILENWNYAKYRQFRHTHMDQEWMDIPICARCDSWACRSRRVVQTGDLIVYQFPYYQHFLPAPSGLSATPMADAAAAVV